MKREEWYQPVVSTTTTSGINQRSGMRCEEVLVTLKQNIKGGDERGQNGVGGAHVRMKRSRWSYRGEVDSRGSKMWP